MQLKDIPFVGPGDLNNTGSTVSNGYSNDTRYAPQILRMPHLNSSSSLSSESIESFREANELLKQEVQKLRAEVSSLRQEREQQDNELQKSEAKAHEAVTLAAEEVSKSKAAKEVIKSLTAQVKEMAERLPPGEHDMKPPRVVYLPGGVVSPEIGGRESQKRYQPGGIHYSQTPTYVASARVNGLPPQAHQTSNPGDNAMVPHESMFENFNKSKDFPAAAAQQRTNGGYRPRSEDFDRRETERFQINLQGWNTRGSGSPSNQVEAEWIEQYEPGVYLTLVSLHDGTKELKRVRFSRRRFGEHQAESWWSENHEKVYDKYNVRRTDRISSVMTS